MIFAASVGAVPCRAVVNHLPRVGYSTRCQFRLAPEFHAALLRYLHSDPSSFNDQRTFKLGPHAYHLPHGAACGRLGVDCLREGTELDTLLFEVVQHVYGVEQAMPQTVELPYDQRVAGLQGLQATGEGRTLHMSAGHLVLEHGLASGLVQRGKLDCRITIFGADAVAVFYAVIMELTFGIR